MKKLFIFRQSRRFIFDAILLDSAFPYLYLDLECKQLCFPPGKGINKRLESTFSELFGTLQSLSELFRTFFRIRVQLLVIDSTDDI